MPAGIISCDSQVSQPASASKWHTLSRKEPPSRLAVAVSEAASLPLLGSVRQYDASLSIVTKCGRYCCRCFSVPYLQVRAHYYHRSAFSKGLP